MAFSDLDFALDASAAAGEAVDTIIGTADRDFSLEASATVQDATGPIAVYPIHSCLRAYYRLEGDYLDGSPFGNHAYPVGAPTFVPLDWMPGSIEGLACLDPGEGLNIPSAIFGNFEDFTIRFYTKPVSNGQTYYLIDGVPLTIVATPLATTFRLGTASALTGPPLPAAFFISGTVSCIAVTRKVAGTTAVIQLRYNGSLVAGYGLSCTPELLPNDVGQSRISLPLDGSGHTAAYWDDIAVWCRALTAAELAYQGTVELPAEPEFIDSAREPIAVDQPSGGGMLYPFTATTPFTGLVADMAIGYSDNTCNFAQPFRLHWLYGGGDEEAPSVPIVPVNPVDAVIRDRNGNVVIDTRTAEHYRADDWAARITVHTWHSTAEGWILRISLHMGTPPDYPPISFLNYIESSSAWLDERVCERRIPHLQSLAMEAAPGTKATGEIELRNGFNTFWETSVEASVDGGRRQTVFTLHASPGDGNGKFGPPCDDQEFLLRTINGVAPDAAGNFILDNDRCLRSEIPVHAELVDGLAMLDHTIQLFDDCDQCCTCDDYVRTYEGIRRLRDRYANLVSRTIAARDLFIANLDRYNSQAACRAQDRLRISVQPLCPDEINIAIGFCNTTDECLSGLVVPINFAYLDQAGDNEPGSEPPTPLTATTVYGAGGDPTIVCESVFREGQANDNPTYGAVVPSRQLYRLGGAYPYFYAIWERVNPGALAVISFRLLFAGSIQTDRVEMVVDAYGVGDGAGTPIGDEEVYPIEGYTPGGGPTSEPAISNRLVPGPKKIVVGLLQECCAAEEEEA